MRPAQRRSNWPVGLSWPAATTIIAVVSLLLSAGQAFISAPLLRQYYFHPDLVVTGAKGSGPKDKVLLAGFMVSNNGNAPATKVEVGFVAEEHQQVSVTPQIA